MDNELMLDENFIRCSTMIAELLMKYKSKENEDVKENEEPEKDSSSSFFARFLLQILLSSFIIYYIGDYC